MTHPRVVLVFSGRIPGEKAASIFAHMEAETFADLAYDTVLLAPARSGRGEQRRTKYRLVYLPTIDLIPTPLKSVAGYVNTLILSLSALAWFVIAGSKRDIVISNEALPLLLLSFFAPTTLYELHDFPESSLAMYSLLFGRVHRIIATNEWKREELMRRFNVPSHKIVVERNAVDVESFGITSKENARATLGLPPSARIALYCGQLYPWKGAGTFAQAAKRLPHVACYFVGGVGDDLKDFRAAWSDTPNIHSVGQVPHESVHLWQAAADVLVLPNSATSPLSEKYTSPMKLFEYMASGRPIVATDVPSAREIVDELSAVFAKPDDAESLAFAIDSVLSDRELAVRISENARSRAGEHSWKKRALRILRAAGLSA